MSRSSPGCNPADHPNREAAVSESQAAALERAARLFRALGDVPRLRLIQFLTGGEWCVTEIVAAVGEKFSTVSQRLRVLRTEGLVTRRRQGNHLYYALADRHVADLIHNALAHAAELETAAPAPPRREGELPMATTHTHADHAHRHGPGCGHTAVKHDGHVDYLHDG